jgi:transporter family-2 protein
MQAAAIPFLLFVGGLLALQAAANVQLSSAMGSPVGASALQLAIGAGLLVALATLVGTLANLGSAADAPAWHLVGGLGSAIYITAGILLFPRLGAVVAVALFIAGQMAASVVLDGTGWLGVPREPPGVATWLGAGAVLGAAILIVRGQAGGAVGRAVARPAAGWLVLALVAGAVLPVQGAINARLRADLDAPITAGAVSFVVAAAAMAAVLTGTLALARGPRPQLGPLRRVPWWGWLGGLCGATYVTAVFSLIPEIGAAPTVALTVAGQQVASVLVDRYGLFRLPRRVITLVRLSGIGLLFAGVALIQVA